MRKAEAESKEFRKLAREAEAAGDPVLAGIYRAEAGNDRSGHYKHHKPNLGPYGPQNLGPLCVDCGKNLDPDFKHPDWKEQCSP